MRVLLRLRLRLHLRHIASMGIGPSLCVCVKLQTKMQKRIV